MHYLKYFLIKLKIHLDWQGWQKKHSTVFLAALVVLIAMVVLIEEKDLLLHNKPTELLTPIILKAVYQQNLTKKLEYTESKPILDSMKKYLHNFESLSKQGDKVGATAKLIIVKRRFSYLERKGLKVTNAEKILDDYLDTINIKNNDEPKKIQK